MIEILKKNKMRTFKRIYIEITNVCNLNCSFCPKTSRNPAFMGIGLFRKILNEVGDYSKYIYFHVMGEPLMHPELETFLDLSGEYGFFANITTNGTLIGKLKEKIISKQALRLINFSLHSFEANTTDSKIDSYLDEIFAFVREAKNKNPKLISCFRLWNVKGNYHHSSNEYILRKIEKFFAFPHEIKEIPLTGNGIKVSENVYVNQSNFFDWPNSTIADLNSKGFCLGLRDQVAILVDGTVVPCCLDSEGTIKLGNIKETSFTEIINSRRALDLYDGFSTRKLVEPLCRKCGYRSRFT